MLNNKNWRPLIYSILLAAGILIGMYLRPSHSGKIFSGGEGRKLREVFGLLENAYVDTINTRKLEEDAISSMLAELDPHSVYLSIDDLKIANEQLGGSFEGIGVEFSIINDTIMVVAPIEGGPSIALGIQSGDRIVQVDTQNVAGVNIKNEEVFKLLRGERGTKVKVKIKRPGFDKLIDYTIVRNTIPVQSVDAAMMIDEHTGYIRVSRFAVDTYEEFTLGLKKLASTPGFSKLIIDLRGNPGGYLDAVTKMVDEVLPDGKLIVYTEGRKQPRYDYESMKKGLYEDGKIAILIDESSASASEIFAGAIQDHDRGIIVGRRSFGKGLVQEPFTLNDGSGLRLTVARYYTPSGRCIQKPYDNGAEAYEHELLDRYENGEVADETKTHLNDSTPYYTQNKRIVFGGGGIMPDIFIPIDTSFRNEYVYELFARNLIRQFVAEYYQAHKNELAKFATPAAYQATFKTPLFGELVKFATKQGLRKPTESETKKSAAYIEKQLRAAIARQIWNSEGYYYIMAADDDAVKKAKEAMANQDKILKP